MNKLFAVLTLSCALATRVLAGTVYIDENPADVWLNALNPAYTGEFDIAGEGFNPATQVLTGAEVEFTLWDLPVLGGSESLKISFGAEQFATHGSFSGFLTFGGKVLGNAFFDLQSDGKLSYTVERTSTGLLSAFWLKNAKLTATAEPHHVPDAGSLLPLLGAALLGLAALRRRS